MGARTLLILVLLSLSMSGKPIDLRAHAEQPQSPCGWVLWREATIDVAGVVWSVVKAWPTFGECGKGREDEVIAFAQKNAGSKRSGDQVAVPLARRADGAASVTGTYRFVCLPSAVDPRQPKAH
jgi:hypothetical protein